MSRVAGLEATSNSVLQYLTFLVVCELEVNEIEITRDLLALLKGESRLLETFLTTLPIAISQVTHKVNTAKGDMRAKDKATKAF